MLIQVALFAISVTLAAYACKVVNCCGSAPKMVSATGETGGGGPPRRRPMGSKLTRAGLLLFHAAGDHDGDVATTAQP